MRKYKTLRGYRMSKETKTKSEGPKVLSKFETKMNF